MNRRMLHVGILICLGLMSVASLAVDEAVTPALESFYHEVDGIRYYVERRGAGPYLVMVTSGQGDSEAYRFLADILAARYTVITFDPPGFSRSGDPPSWDNMSSALLGDQVASLVRSLGIERATYYGSSSGGTTVLSLVADHPELVRRAILHEPAVMADTPLFSFVFPKMIAFRAWLGGGFAEDERSGLSGEGEALMILDLARYRELGEAHLERRINNKEIWFRRYAEPDIPCCNRKFTAEELSRAPVTVTVGELTLGLFADGVRAVAERAGGEAITVPAKHFPYVTIPQHVADLIYEVDADSLNK